MKEFEVRIVETSTIFTRFDTNWVSSISKSKNIEQVIASEDEYFAEFPKTHLWDEI